MKQKVLTVTLVVLIIFMGVPLDFAVKYKTASVVEVTGMVSILKAGGEKAFTPEVNTKLEHGDRIITGKGASISLQIDSDKYIKVGEKTYMSLSELMSEAESGGDSTNIQLFTGKVWASLSKPLGGDDSFEIETPTAVMGAKGTKFYVKYMISPTPEQKEKSSTELVVLEGKVSMKTQVSKQGEGDVSPSTQDVELLANANETLLLDPELVQGISDEITSRIDAGETIDQINIQEVVSKVGKAKQIEVKDLDLFVLEIVADEPESYDPALTNGLDQLIEQKKQELPPEEGPDEGINKIIYDQISDADGAKTPATPETPKVPETPATPTNPSKDDDEDETEALEVTKVEVVDAVSDDGIADHIVMTFNQDVRDSTYVASSGAYIESGGMLGTIDTSKISNDKISGVTDVSNDSVLVFNLNTSGKSINTIPLGSFNVPHSGMIQSKTGISLGTVSNLITIDKIAPVVIGAMVSFEGAAEDKYIKLVYSEPVYDISSDLWHNIRIAASEEMLYSDAQAIGYEMTSSSAVYVEAQKLDYSTVNYLKNAALDGHEDIRLKMNSEVPAYVSDAGGNQRLLQKNISLLGVAMDTQKAMVSDVTVQTLTPNTDYLFTVKLDDYLPTEQMQTLIETPQSFLKGSFSNATAEFTDIRYVYDSTDQININFHVKVQSDTLSAGDVVTIDYSYLKDLFDYPVTDYFDSEEQTTRTYYYDSTGDTWTMDAPPSSDFYATSAATIDVDGDGLVDHLQVTFNNPVDDSTFIAENGIALQSDNLLDPVDDTQIITNLTGAYTDTPDDAIVYLKLDHSTSSISYNTDGMGILTIPAGTIKNLVGALNDATQGMRTVDHAAPVIVAAGYAFEGSRDDKSIKLVTSEAFTSTSFETPDFRIFNNDTSSYTDAYPIAFGKMDKHQGEHGNEMKMSGLDYDTVKRMMQYVDADENTFLYFNDGLTIADVSGNQTVLTGKNIVLHGSVSDSSKTMIKSVKLKEQPLNQYVITLVLDDYLDDSSATNYMVNLEHAAKYMGSNNSMTVGGYSYDYGVSADVTLSFVVQMMEPLTTKDRLSINIEGLYDYNGLQTGVISGDPDRTQFDIAYDSDWTIDLSSLDILEVNTMDSDGNGKIDLIEVVFDKAVNDESFVDVGAVLNSSLISPGTVDMSQIASPSGIDYPNDTKIYFSVTEGEVVNTAAEGTLDLTSAGMFESIYAHKLPALNSIEVKDKAGPVFVDSVIDLSLPFDEKFIALKFSEPLNESDTVDVSKLKLMSSGCYASGPVDLYGTTSVLGDQIFIKPLELGNVETSAPSFISKLSKYLYKYDMLTSGDARIRLDSGFAISSAKGENYVLPYEYTYPYDGPLSSEIKRINDTSKVSSITSVTSGSSVIVTLTYDDYVESWNHFSSAYKPATTNVYASNFGIMSQKIGSDHKSLELELCSMPQNGDIIIIQDVRNITNSYGDDAHTAPIYAESLGIIFDGTEWQKAPY